MQTRIKVMGIDLAGSEENITGICVLKRENCDVKLELFSVHKNDEILERVVEEKPAIIGIDAPLSFYGKPFRDCDLELRKYCRILPLTFQGMRSLTKRGIKLAKIIREEMKFDTAVEVIEVYPYATRKILCVGEGEKDEESLRKHTNVKYEHNINIKNEHEFDAILCAITAKFYSEGEYRAFGKKDEIIVPYFPNVNKSNII